MWKLSKPQKALIESLRAGEKWEFSSDTWEYHCGEKRAKWATVKSLVKDGLIERPEFNLVLTKLGREVEIR